MFLPTNSCKLLPASVQTAEKANNVSTFEASSRRAELIEQVRVGRMTFQDVAAHPLLEVRSAATSRIAG